MVLNCAPQSGAAESGICTLIPTPFPIGLKRRGRRGEGELCQISPALYEYLMSPAAAADEAAEAEFMMSPFLLTSVSATSRTAVDLPFALSELTYEHEHLFTLGSEMRHRTAQQGSS